MLLRLGLVGVPPLARLLATALGSVPTVAIVVGDGLVVRPVSADEIVLCDHR